MTYQQQQYQMRESERTRIAQSLEQERNTVRVHVIGGKAMVAIRDKSERRITVCELSTLGEIDGLMTELLKARRLIQLAAGVEPCPRTQRNDEIRGAK